MQSDQLSPIGADMTSAASLSLSIYNLLLYYSPVSVLCTQKWEVVAQLPGDEAGYEYSALASYRSRVILVGGRSKVSSIG